MGSHRNENTSRRPILTFVMAAVAIAINLGCLSFNIIRSASSENFQVASDGTRICVTCIMLTNHGKGADLNAILRKLERGNDGGTEKCCAENMEQMWALMELLTAKRTPELSSLMRNASPISGPISAHKCLIPPPSAEFDLRFPKDGSVPLALNATNNEHVTEHAQNVDVLPSGLRVLYSGLYHVYSEINFGPYNTKPCSEFSVKTWNHTVTRVRPNERQSSGVILRSLHTCCDNCKGDKETSYAAGVFELQAGDHLSVEVSGHGLFRVGKESSFVGVIMLGGVTTEMPPTY